MNDQQIEQLRKQTKLATDALELIRSTPSSQTDIRLLMVEFVSFTVKGMFNTVGAAISRRPQSKNNQKLQEAFQDAKFLIVRIALEDLKSLPPGSPLVSSRAKILNELLQKKFTESLLPNLLAQLRINSRKIRSSPEYAYA